MSKHTSGAMRAAERLATFLDCNVDSVAAIIDQETAAERKRLREALMDCEHVMNITANQLCIAVERSDLTGANKRLVECVIRTRTTLYETALAEPESGEKKGNINKI